MKFFCLILEILFSFNAYAFEPIACKIFDRDKGEGAEGLLDRYEISAEKNDFTILSSADTSTSPSIVRPLEATKKDYTLSIVANEYGETKFTVFLNTKKGREEISSQRVFLTMKNGDVGRISRIRLSIVNLDSYCVMSDTPWEIDRLKSD